ncbi:MAG: NAD(P)-dependent oxidoreductase [Actinobacteria bacterium]|nr:NAD(P)-dependent oxidoreductase [Actinomycetota bacterium]
MRVLVTGHRGRLGGAVCAALEAAGHEWAGFDREEGDVRDVAALTAAAAGAGAIVHLAGLADDVSDDAFEKMSVNALGTWSVLLAAEAAGVGRVVNFSSGKALGMTERLPDYLPIDDDHPAAPTRAYGLAKLLSEQMCEAFTRRTGVPTVCLRPVAVFDRDDYGRWERQLAAEEPSVDVPWHMGVFVDVRDTAAAAVLALTRPEHGHVRLLLCAEDPAIDGETAALARERMPSVAWRCEPGPRAAFVDCRGAERVLGWRPCHRWDRRP